MKKTILVSVDRGETRVSVLEGKGAPSRSAKGGRRKKAQPGDEWKVSELYVERRGKRSIVGNIYKGKVDNVLPGMEAAFVDIGLERNGFLHVDEIVTPDGKAVPKRGRGRGRQHRRAAEARPGDHRPGRQGPPEDEGSPAVHAALHRRPLSRLHAAGRRHRRLQAPSGRRAPAPAQADRGHGHRGRWRDRAHRGPGREEGGLQARDRLPPPPQRGRRAARREVRGGPDGLPGGGPLDPRRPRRAGRGVRGSDHRRRQAARSRHEVPRAHGARARFERRALQGEDLAAREVGRPEGVRLGPVEAGRPALGRLSHDRLRRGV